MSTEIKKYRLLKDLPDYKAGEVFSFDGKFYVAETVCADGEKGKWPPIFVEDNPKWFFLLPTLSFNVTNIGNLYAGSKANTIVFEVFPSIETDKLSLIKQAIESVLNN